MPSAHRTGSPISWRFSIKRTSHSGAAVAAAKAPAGPAPTTMISYSLFTLTPLGSGNEERADWAYCDTSFARRTTFCNFEARLDKRYRISRTNGYTGATVSTFINIDLNHGLPPFGCVAEQRVRNKKRRTFRSSTGEILNVCTGDPLRSPLRASRFAPFP